MKKIFLIVIFIFTIAPLTSFAFTKTPNVEYVDLIYSPVSDNYFLNYYLPETSDQLYYTFITFSGTTYSNSWGPEAINKTIRLNCNGTYNEYFKLNNVTIASIENIVTTEVVNPICIASFPGTDEESLNITGNGGNVLNGADYGQYRIDYTPVPGATTHRLQRSTNNKTSWTTIDTNGAGDDYFVVNGPGLYRIDGLNGSNQLIARDVIGSTEFKDGCGDLCKVFQCPGLNDLIDELAAVIPTPATAESIGESVVDKLAEQDTEPAAPTAPAPFDPGYAETETDLPAPIETDLEPAPTDFNPVTGGDGSGAFTLTDPMNWTPDDNDKSGGYVPPDADPDTLPAYTAPGGDTETPSYNAPGGTGDTPPAYNPPGAPADTIPGYAPTGAPADTIPGYNHGGGGSTDIPDYNYE